MKESELLQEASEIMQKMKSMPGMGDLQAMLAKMGMGHMMPGGAGGGKMNTSAMKANLDRNIKAAKNKERMLAKLETRKQSQAEQAASLHSVGVDAQGRESLVFSKGEQVERSVKPSAATSTADTSAADTSAADTSAADTSASTDAATSKTSGAAKKKKNKNNPKTVEATAE
jgi:hypothetical protein